MVLKNLDIGDVFPQQHKNAHVPPHENTKIARNAIVFPALITIVLGTILEGNTERKATPKRKRGKHTLLQEASK